MADTNHLLHDSMDGQACKLSLELGVSGLRCGGHNAIYQATYWEHLVSRNVLTFHKRCPHKSLSQRRYHGAPSLHNTTPALAARRW